MPPCELISASNGASFQLSDLYFPSFLDLKQFVGETFHISVDDILLLLSYGIILKRSKWDSTKIRSEGLKSIYVFDRKLFNEDIELAIEERFRLFKPLDSPMSDLSEVDRNIVLRNMGWLKALQSDVEFFQLSIEQTRKEVQNMLDCGVVMLEYLKNYCHEVETLYNSHVGFLNKLHEHSASSQWREVYNSVLEAVKIDQQRSLASFFEIDELNQIEARICHTDHELNMKLKELKKTIDTCYQHRKTLVSELENIKSISVASPDCMDKQMTDKFNEMAQELEAASNEWVQNSENNDHISEKLKQMKDSHIPKLQTISQSLFNKASKIIETKTDMQRQLRSLYISVAKSQMDIIEVKSTLTKDMKSDMKLLQTYELQLSQVLDLPMCYGLYLIELYRQQLWMDNYTHIKDQHESALQKMLQEEIHQRKMWFRDFQWISKFLKVDQSLPSTVSITPLKALKRVDLLQINEYFNQLSSAKVSETTLNVLKSKLSQAEMDNILPELSEQSSNDTGAAIEGYKSRIKKLENLLLDAQFQRYDSWPSGILNKEIAMVQMFRNNTLNNKVQRSSTDDISNSTQQSYSKTLGDVQNLQKAISEYSGLTDTLKEELSTLKSQISNMEVEKNAYKESMANLNKELFNDIESLAKKLRKENKNKKILLQKYTNDKITINNFQLGDLALFLPINDQELLLNSSVSSLNSSFSSIDLNSSTQSMIPPRTIPNRVEPASNTNNSNPSSVPEYMGSPNMNRINTMGNVKVNANVGSNNSSNNYVNTSNENGNNKPETNIDTTSSANAESPKKQIVWAIFTATNTEVKYILRNTMSNYELLREKEWAKKI
ncbi:oligomeric, coiled-coil, peripheral membrane protein [Kluyveromyces marxianus]|nr:oligomeric, coiled-coil, peripheral membrane protein [Kluyveromyces marxianus]